MSLKLGRYRVDNAPDDVDEGEIVNLTLGNDRLDVRINAVEVILTLNAVRVRYCGRGVNEEVSVIWMHYLEDPRRDWIVIRQN